MCICGVMEEDCKMEVNKIERVEAASKEKWETKKNKGKKYELVL